MEAVAKQLRNATQYKDIQLWDIVPLRIQEGKDTREEMRLPGALPSGSFPSASITIHPEAVYSKDKARYVRFSQVNMDFRIPYMTTNNSSTSFFAAALRTSGDFMEGQKTVVGKVSGTGDDDAIFAVIAFRILD